MPIHKWKRLVYHVIVNEIDNTCIKQ